MSLEASIEALTAEVKALAAQLQLHHDALMTAAGHPGRTPSEIAAAYGRASSDPKQDIPPTEVKGRGRPVGSTKDKAAPQQKPAPQEAAEAGEADFDPFADADEAPARVYNIKEITAALRTLNQRDAAGKAASIGILQKLGVKGVGEIPEAKFGEVADSLAKHGVAV